MLQGRWMGVEQGDLERFCEESRIYYGLEEASFGKGWWQIEGHLKRRQQHRRVWVLGLQVAWIIEVHWGTVPVPNL